MRVAITGAGGMLGWDWANAVEARGWQAIRLTHEDLDISYPSKVHESLRRLRPDIVASAAAFTQVDACEFARDAAMKINFAGAAHLAQSTADLGIPLVHLSTDYVFDGRKSSPYREEDPAYPLNVYGESKWLGEEAVRQENPRHCIVRTSWLFGLHGRNFVETVLALGARGEAMSMVADQIGAPTYTHDLAQRLCDLMAAEARGTYHLTNTGECSWHVFCLEILKQAGLSSEVMPITSEQLNRPAKRPANSRLANVRAAALGIAPLRPWREALTHYLARRALMNP